VGDGGKMANPKNDVNGIIVGAKHSGQPIGTEQDDVAGNADNVGAKRSGQPVATQQDDVAGNASPLQHPNQPHHRPITPTGAKPGSFCNQFPITFSIPKGHSV